MAKTALKTSTAAVAPKKEQFDGSLYAFHEVEVVKGKKFEIGMVADCVKAGISRKGRPYCIISVNGVDEFIDPANVKPLKALKATEKASIEAEQEAAREATMIVSGLIKNESEKAVLLAHHNWFRPRWFPKSLVTKLGEHDDGVQSLYEVPRWKIATDHGPKGVEELDALQEGFEAMLEPKAPAGKSLVKGQTTIIRKAK